MFSLVVRNPQYFTCSGRLHIKTAFAIVVLFTVVLDIIQLVAYIKSDQEMVTTWSEAILEVWEWFVSFTMILALIKESSLLVIPFIFEMFVVITVMFISILQLVWCVFFPWSTRAMQIIDNVEMNTRARVIFFLFVLALMATMTTVLSWCLHVALAVYKYFEDINAERKTRESRPGVSQLPPLVNQQPANPASFPNPNFSIEDQDEEVVFPQKPNASEIV